MQNGLKMKKVWSSIGKGRIIREGTFASEFGLSEVPAKWHSNVLKAS